jgi:hypothetical protein
LIIYAQVYFLTVWRLECPKARHWLDEGLLAVSSHGHMAKDGRTKVDECLSFIWQKRRQVPFSSPFEDSPN